MAGAPKPYYQDDSVTIYHADALELLPDLQADVCITDPPYNVGMAYPSGDQRDDFPEWTKQWFDLAPRPLIFTPGLKNLAIYYNIAKPTWLCSWHKLNQMSQSALSGWSVWEPVLVYGLRRKPVGHDAWTSPMGTQNDVGDHPCPKPLFAWRKLVNDFSLADDLILDPFAGTGTTLRAAKDLGRKAIGIEIEERYCEIAAQRCAQEVLELTA